jgi:hypothetical protein
MPFLVQSLELNITVSAEELEPDVAYRGIKYTLETWGQMYLFYKFTLDSFYTFCNFKKKETEIDRYWQNNLILLLAECEGLIFLVYSWEKRRFRVFVTHKFLSH